MVPFAVRYVVALTALAPDIAAETAYMASDYYVAALVLVVGMRRTVAALTAASIVARSAAVALAHMAMALTALVPVECCD